MTRKCHTKKKPTRKQKKIAKLKLEAARKRKSHYMHKLICSDCGYCERYDRFEMIRAFRIKCPQCGGPMNKPEHTTFKWVEPKVI